MNRTLIVSKVLTGQGPRVNLFRKIIIVILRLNYSHNHVLVAPKQRQSYNGNNVKPSKWTFNCREVLSLVGDNAFLDIS